MTATSPAAPSGGWHPPLIPNMCQCLLHKFQRVPEPEYDPQEKYAELIEKASKKWPVWDIADIIKVSIVSYSGLLTYLTVLL